MFICQICRKDQIKMLLNCGPQPLCNRFLKDPSEEEFLHPLALGQCTYCGLIQLTKPVPDPEITPRFEWLTYNEPEGHLDHLADFIKSLPGIDRHSVAFGITYKDDSLLRRLEFEKIWRIDPKNDLSISIPGAGGETVQAQLKAESAVALVEKHGRADVLIARHIYEHASDTQRILDALKQLVNPMGYIVFEIPDCTRLFKSMDYSMLWEEHILYFTPETFRNSFMFSGLSLIHYECYSYPVENALVAVVQVDDGVKPVLPTSEALESQLTIGKAYGDGFEIYADKLKHFIETYREKEGKIAVFGAGHLSCMFINLMELEHDIEFVVDDNPNKKGLYMPGSKLSIYGSDALINKEISLCLLSLSPDSEKKVIANNQRYLNGGGEFRSIFPSAEFSILYT